MKKWQSLKILVEKILVEKIFAEKVWSKNFWPKKFRRDENGGREGRGAALLVLKNHKKRKRPNNAAERPNRAAERPNSAAERPNAVGMY